ncbi:MAG TPA: hypothetical protein VK941_10195, partial [Gillisia sp.]|nr:hypothetical protein [Gillisia sp.]
KQLLLEYLEQVIKILQDETNEAELSSFLRKVQVTEIQISSWSFDLINTWIDLTNIEQTKSRRIKKLTRALENKI